MHPWSLLLLLDLDTLNLVSNALWNPGVSTSVKAQTQKPNLPCLKDEQQAHLGGDLGPCRIGVL